MAASHLRILIESSHLCSFCHSIKKKKLSLCDSTNTELPEEDDVLYRRCFNTLFPDEPPNYVTRMLSVARPERAQQNQIANQITIVSPFIEQGNMFSNPTSLGESARRIKNVTHINKTKKMGWIKGKSSNDLLKTKKRRNSHRWQFT